MSEHVEHQLEIDSSVAVLRPNRSNSIQLLSVGDLLKMPPPAWLIDGVLEEGAFGVLYGPSGEGKTFVALDLSLSVASDRKWHGRSVTGGSVVYVVAEGGRNIGTRIAAWMQEHDLGDLENMFAVLQAVEMPNSANVSELQRAIAQKHIRPRLIVIDTLARCFGGGDENSAQDMNQFVRGCDQLRHATGAAVLAVHHTGKGMNSATERGSSALRGAADAMIRVQRQDGGISVTVDKQKDAELLERLRFRLRPVTIRQTRSDRRETSCVLALSGRDAERSLDLGAGPLRTLKVLLAQSGIAEAGTWREGIFKTDGAVLPKRTFENHRSVLLEQRLIEPVDGRRHSYQITETGRAIACGVPSTLQRHSPESAASATPLEGVAGGTEAALTTAEQTDRAMRQPHRCVHDTAEAAAYMGASAASDPEGQTDAPASDADQSADGTR